MNDPMKDYKFRLDFAIDLMKGYYKRARSDKKKAEYLARQKDYETKLENLKKEDSMERTTDLNFLIRHIYMGINNKIYTWGEIITIHHIGDYDIVEYYPWKVDGVTVLTGSPDYDDRSFSIYIYGKCLSTSYGSLDEALVGCVAHKYDGCNTRAVGYFFGGIGREEHRDYKNWRE